LAGFAEDQLSATMMLDHLGLTDAARALVNAVDAVYADGTHLTPDQGGTATATQFCAAVEAALTPSSKLR
jgi:isocitrate/isopropylmalate dehydrogenase